MKYIFYITIFLCLTGCKTKTIYVPAETVKTEYKDRLQRDSIHLHDSVFVYVKGDTLWMEKYRTIFREQLRIDSVIINDTIRVPYPVTETREVNRIYTWQIILMCLGGVLVGNVVYRLINVFRRS